MKFLLTDILKSTNPNITADNLVRIPDEISLDGVALESWVNDNFDNYNYFNLQTNGIQRQKVRSENILNIVGGLDTGISYVNGAVSINTLNTQLTDAQVKSIINTVGYLKLIDLNGYALESWVNNNFDDYDKWNLKLNGVQKTTIQSNGMLDLVQGSNVNLTYSAGGKITIDATDTNTQLTDAEVKSIINTVGYLKSVDLNGYATENYVNNQGFITSYVNTQLTDAEVKSIIATVGYLKLVDLNGYATENYVNSQGFITSYTDTNTQLTDAQVKSIIATVGYLTNHQSITGKADKSTIINTGAGLIGGGNLSTDRTIELTQSTQDSLLIARSALQVDNITAGSNITLNKSGNDITINSTGSGDDYGYFNLQTNGIQRKQIGSHDILNIVGTNDTGITYGVDGQVMINTFNTQLTDAQVKSIIATVGYLRASDITIKADKTTSINTGAGLTGGGNLYNDRTIELTQSTLESLLIARSAIQPEDLNGYATENYVNNQGFITSYTDTNTQLSNSQVKNIIATVGYLKLADISGKADKSIAINSGTGLIGGGNLSENRSIKLSPDALSNLSLAASALQPNDVNGKADKVTSINTSNGITGGGNLSNDRTFKLTQGTLDNLGKAASALQQEYDPIFQASPASDVTNDDISNYRDNFEYSRKRVVKEIVSETSFYNLKDLITDSNLTATHNSKMYVIKMGTLGTGAITGNAYLLYPSRSDDTWNIRKLNVMNESSSNGTLFLDNGIPKIKTFHPNDYIIQMFIEEYNISSKYIQTGVMGSETSFTVEGVLKSFLDHDIYAYDNYDNKARMWTDLDFSLSDLEGHALDSSVLHKEGDEPFKGIKTINNTSSGILINLKGLTNGGHKGMYVDYGNVHVQGNYKVGVLSSDGWVNANKGTITKSTSKIVLRISGNTLLEKGLCMFSGFSSFATGDVLYLGNGGDIINVKPDNTGDVVRVIGYCVSNNIVSFEPDNTWIVLN